MGCQKYINHQANAAGSALRGLALVTDFNKCHNKWGKVLHTAMTSIPIQTELDFSEEPWAHQGRSFALWFLQRLRETCSIQMLITQSQSTSVTNVLNLLRVNLPSLNNAEEGVCVCVCVWCVCVWCVRACMWLTLLINLMCPCWIKLLLFFY